MLANGAKQSLSTTNDLSHIANTAKESVGKGAEMQFSAHATRLNDPDINAERSRYSRSGSFNGAPPSIAQKTTAPAPSDPDISAERTRFSKSQSPTADLLATLKG